MKRAVKQIKMVAMECGRELTHQQAISIYIRSQELRDERVDIDFGWSRSNSWKASRAVIEDE